MPHQSYAQYCALARALDVVGDRWTLLIVRELLAGPRRYTDLHADLPGVSTDILASRLKELERSGVVVRRRLPAPGSVVVYELTERGCGLLPSLTALAGWGAVALDAPGQTDAIRAHWFALPLLDEIRNCSAGNTGVVNVCLDEGVFHICLGAVEYRYANGPSSCSDVEISLDARTCAAIAQRAQSLHHGVKEGQVRVTGESELAAALRGE